MDPLLNTQPADNGTLGFSQGDLAFGRYRLRRLAGQGRHGDVWEARDERTGVPVAVKVFPVQERADVEALTRCATRVAGLSHPNLVRVHQTAREGDRLGLVMDWVEGSSLSPVIHRRDPPFFEVEEAESWVWALFSALDFLATQARVAHGDVRPANLLVDRTGTLKIVGYSFIRYRGERLLDETVDQDVSLALGCLSPQALHGEMPAPADDVYAGAACVYELLTGRPLFYGSGLASQIQMIVPPRIADRRTDLRVQGGEIPAHWEAWIGRCLAKDPAGRPSASDVLRMLRGEISAEASGPTAFPVPHRSDLPISLQTAQAPVATVATASAPAATATVTATAGATAHPSSPASPALASQKSNMILALVGGLVILLCGIAGLVWATYHLKHSSAATPAGQTPPPPAPEQPKEVVAKIETPSPASVTSEEIERKRLADAREKARLEEADRMKREEEANRRAEETKRKLAEDIGAAVAAEEAKDGSSGAAVAERLAAWTDLLAKCDVPANQGLPGVETNLAKARSALQNWRTRKETEDKKAKEVADWRQKKKAEWEQINGLSGDPNVKIADRVGRLDAYRTELAAGVPEGAQDALRELNDQAAQLRQDWMSAAAAQTPDKPLPLKDLFTGDVQLAGQKDEVLSEALRKVQGSLKDQGMYEGSIDGDPGPGTHKALLAFQAAHQLPPTASCDAATLNALSLSQMDVDALRKAAANREDDRPRRSRQVEDDRTWFRKAIWDPLTKGSPPPGKRR